MTVAAGVDVNGDGADAVALSVPDDVGIKVASLGHVAVDGLGDHGGVVYAQETVREAIISWIGGGVGLEKNLVSFLIMCIMPQTFSVTC